MLRFTDLLSIMSSSSSCKSVGTITISFQGQPAAGMNYVTDPALNSVVVKLSAAASAIDYGAMLGGTPSTIVADDGLGDSQSVGQYTVSSSVIKPAFGSWPSWTRRYALGTMPNLQYMQR